MKISELFEAKQTRERIAMIKKKYSYKDEWIKDVKSLGLEIESWGHGSKSAHNMNGKNVGEWVDSFDCDNYEQPHGYIKAAALDESADLSPGGANLKNIAKLSDVELVDNLKWFKTRRFNSGEGGDVVERIKDEIKKRKDAKKVGEAVVTRTPGKS